MRKQADEVYWVMVTDMVHSKEVEDRRDFGARLKIVLQDLAHRHGDSFLAPLVQSKGIDELSAIIRSPSALPAIMVDLAMSLFPQELRFAVALGEVSPLSKVATEADGAAFHAATRALQLAERERRFFKLGGLRSAGWEMAQFLMHQSLALIYSWPPATGRAAREKWLYPALKNEQLAEHFGVSPQAISKKLRRSRLDELRESHRLLQEWFATTTSSLPV